MVEFPRLVESRCYDEEKNIPPNTMIMTGGESGQGTHRIDSHDRPRINRLIKVLLRAHDS